MKISLTRDDIRRHAEALRRAEELEKWLHTSQRQVGLMALNDTRYLRVNCSCCTPSSDHDGVRAEAIFKKHLDEAVREAIAFWLSKAEVTGG